MSMPAPSGSRQTIYVQRRGNGCLWGCLGVILILFLPILLAGGYGTWFLYDGYRRDPVLRVVGELVKQNGTAHRVLGDNVAITGVEGNAFSWASGMGRSSAYVVTLSGSRGEGHLAVTSHAGGATPKLDSAILTGPDGMRYDLLNSTILPAEPDHADDSI